MTLRDQVLGVYVGQGWLSDDEAFVNPVLVGLTRKRIRDTLYQIKFNCKDYTYEKKQDGGTTFRRVVKREKEFTPRDKRANLHHQHVNGTSGSTHVVGSIVNGESGYTDTVKEVKERNLVIRPKKVAGRKYVAKFCREAISKLNELKKLANCNTNIISPQSILYRLVLLERDVEALRERVVKDKP